MAGTIKLGTEPVEYTSAAQRYFSPIEAREQKVLPTYKNYNQRVDIITGEIKDINQKNCGYERFTTGKQHMKSSD
jgi:hypothetical protein